MMFPLMRELAREGIPVTLSCRVLDFSRQGHCAWRVDPVLQREWRDERMINEIRAIRKVNPALG